MLSSTRNLMGRDKQGLELKALKKLHKILLMDVPKNTYEIVDLDLNTTLVLQPFLREVSHV